MEDYISYWAKNVDGEERKTPTRILEEPAQPSFLPSVNSYRLFLLQVMGPLLEHEMILERVRYLEVKRSQDT